MREKGKEKEGESEQGREGRREGQREIWNKGGRQGGLEEGEIKQNYVGSGGIERMRGEREGGDVIWINE